MRERANRRDTRLPDWDYRHPGPYAVTLCTQHRRCLLGAVARGTVQLSEQGEMVDNVWRELGQEFPGIGLDRHVVMPNHLHAIVVIGPVRIASNPDLGTVIQRFNSITTARYSQQVHDQRWEPFDGRLWQRNYYDHIIRNHDDLLRCRRYIELNPTRWESDIDRNQATQESS